MSMYVVTMHRWGQRYGHTYVVGAYKTPMEAAHRGAMEEGNRGGCKYEARITRCTAGNRAELRRDVFNPHRGGMSKFMLRLALNRAVAWYAAGGYSRFGGL